MSVFRSNNGQQMDSSAIVSSIFRHTNTWNRDNISRTAAYLSFFKQHPEIRWSFLASMVSRNAGWNMCDLEGATLSKALPLQVRRELFMAYEMANYLIFRDAYPQLLLYHYSTKKQSSLFHLLPAFFVSNFMKEEWEAFVKGREKERLMRAMIINEQNVIQRQVIEGEGKNKNIFETALFAIQDRLHFSTVIFPTKRGELFGSSVSGFKKVSARIYLGKKLASILFSAELFPAFYQFALDTEHTGSRRDYEQYYSYRKQRETPYLRACFPIIHHELLHLESWDTYTPIKRKWMNPVVGTANWNMTEQYEKKQREIRLFASLKNILR
ncbi:DUF2515 family protein [Bacillus sp. 1P06AnD]|uniref:DUF2515 family protein n=1 Tax=Bacillus sp. 1P06AnD TaxID=3132208 RepID=UPI00399EFC8D